MRTFLILFFIFFSTSVHADISSESFYQTPSGEMIMDSSTYSKGIIEFLEMEQNFIKKSIEHYDIFFEIGCGTSQRAIEFKNTRCNFFGIDINPRFIQLSSHFFTQHKLHEKAQTKEFSVKELNSSNFPVSHDKKTLIYFPFNLLGNLENFEDILKNMVELGKDFCFSSYKITEGAYIARREYYLNCGCENLKYEKTANGDVFSSSDGLRSVAFHEGYIKTLVEKIVCDSKRRASIHVHEFANLGYVLEVKGITLLET